MNSKPEVKRFELPMMSVIRYSQDKEGHVAHALDFDLVAVGATEAEATKKIRWAIKSYVEFGLKNYWQNHIIFRAPEDIVNELSPEKVTLKLMEPIVVQDRTLGLARMMANDEAKRIAGVA